MKKLLLAASLLVSSVLTSYAQDPEKPTAGKKTFTFGIQGINTFNLTGASVAGGTLLFRYYLSDNLALRVGANYARTANTSIDETASPTITTQKTRTSDFFLVPGAQVSLGDNQRVEPYIGADLLFGLGRSRTETIVEGPGATETITKQGPQTHIGLIPAVGFNWWVVQGLAIGAEFNWGPRWTFVGEGSTTSGGNTTTSKTKSRSSNFTTHGGGLITVTVMF
ncbi:MAG: hypothetical protein ACK40G_15900 [Cytophagaceae bacterium]